MYMRELFNLAIAAAAFWVYFALQEAPNRSTSPH